MIHNIACQPKTSGGSAFPYVGQEWPGMQLWHYFAARAPEEVPDWFTPELQREPPRPAYEFCDNCKADTDDCTTPAICRKIHLWFDACSKIRLENKITKFVQWRCVYADLMIAEIERRGKNL